MKIANSGSTGQSTGDAAILGIALDRGLAQPLHAQLAAHLRGLILSARIPPGSRLPSSRVLAQELSVSRVTVTTAIDQLASEGYTASRHGSGVYVVDDLPEAVLQAPAAGQAPAVPDLADPPPLRPFQPAAADLALFPHAEWARLLDQSWRAPEAALLGPSDPAGYGPLRTAIARHLAQWRGIACGPRQVIVTAGAADAAHLIAEALLAPGADMVMEDPGHAPLRHRFRVAGLNLVSVAVDGHGLDPAQVRRRARPGAGVLVTPSRQFPLGMAMPLARRLDLLDWARVHGGLVVEDDFDSEFRYQGTPLPALAGLDEAGSVIYLGSMSKVLASGLRLGFMVVPARHLAAVEAALENRPSFASLVAQPALAAFIASGRFAAHIRRMRRLYARRQAGLVAAVRRHLDGLLEVAAEPAGMHLVAGLAPALARRMDDREASRRAAAAGLVAPALSDYYDGAATRHGLVLGYAGFDEAELAAACRRLAAALSGKPRAQAVA